MAGVLPARVQPGAGADVADFPWAAAGRALDQLNATAAKLKLVLETREFSIDAVADWEGGYRREFDAVHRDLQSEGGGLQDALNRLAGAIVEGANEANTQQVRNDDRAEAEATEAAARSVRPV